MPHAGPTDSPYEARSSTALGAPLSDVPHALLAHACVGDAQLLTPEQVARALNITRTRVYELLGTGELASVKLGRVRRVSVRALREFVNLLEGP